MTWSQMSAALRANKQPCRMLNKDGKPDPQCTFVATELHHGIFPRSSRFADWIDHKINACPSCHNCNFKRIADNTQSRTRWFQHQLRAHGKRTMKAWLSAAPDEIKWRSEFRTYWNLLTDQFSAGLLAEDA